MAFTNTKGRYATFGVVTSLPGEVIDSFWYIIDQYLKHVISLDNTLYFQLHSKKGKLSISFLRKKKAKMITVDFPYKFDPFYPHTIVVVDRNGKETIAIPDELINL